MTRGTYRIKITKKHSGSLMSGYDYDLNCNSCSTEDSDRDCFEMNVRNHITKLCRNCAMELLGDLAMALTGRNQ